VLQVTDKECLVRVNLKGVEGDAPLALDWAFFDVQIPSAKDEMTEIQKRW